MEKDIEHYLVRRVKALGGHAYKFVSPTNRGVSDRLVVLPGGEIWFVEVKQVGGKVSPLQRVFFDEMRRLGTNYALLWSKEEVDAFIEARSREGR